MFLVISVATLWNDLVIVGVQSVIVYSFVSQMFFAIGDIFV